MMGLPDLMQVMTYLLIFTLGSLGFIWGLFITFGWIHSIIENI